MMTYVATYAIKMYVIITYVKILPPIRAQFDPPHRTVYQRYFNMGIEIDVTFARRDALDGSITGIRILLAVVPTFVSVFYRQDVAKTMFIPCAIVVSDVFFWGLVGPFLA